MRVFQIMVLTDQQWYSFILPVHFFILKVFLMCCFEFKKILRSFLAPIEKVGWFYLVGAPEWQHSMWKQAVMQAENAMLGAFPLTTGKRWHNHSFSIVTSHVNTYFTRLLREDQCN